MTVTVIFLTRQDNHGFKALQERDLLDIWAAPAWLVTCCSRHAMNSVSPAPVIDSSSVSDVPLSLTVHLGGRDVTMTDIQALQSGMALPLNTLIGAPLDLFVGNVRFASVEVVVRDGSLCARVVELCQVPSLPRKTSPEAWSRTMNSDQVAGLLGEDWRRTLSQRLNLPLEIAPRSNENPAEPAGGAEWTWVCLGSAPEAIYVGASSESWRDLAERIGGDAEGSVVSPGCQAVLAAAWNELAMHLALPASQEAQPVSVMPQEFDPGTSRRIAWHVALPGSERLLLTTVFGEGLMRAAPRIYRGEVAPELADLRFSLHVAVARCGMDLKDVLRLAQGSMIELGKRAGDPIEIRVNGRLLGKGRAATCGERYGVSLTRPSRETSEEPAR